MDLLFSSPLPQCNSRETQQSEEDKRENLSDNITLPLIATALAYLNTRYPFSILKWLARGALAMAALPVAKRALN
ncbi:MAG: hypothetical protein NZ901_05530 [Geminocystis sp.]|nr:hypothetical protein [Geminocystis sp.]